MPETITRFGDVHKFIVDAQRNGMEEFGPSGTAVGCFLKADYLVCPHIRSDCARVTWCQQRPQTSRGQSIGSAILPRVRTCQAAEEGPLSCRE